MKNGLCNYNKVGARGNNNSKKRKDLFKENQSSVIIQSNDGKYTIGMDFGNKSDDSTIFTVSFKSEESFNSFTKSFVNAISNYGKHNKMKG